MVMVMAVLMEMFMFLANNFHVFNFFFFIIFHPFDVDVDDIAI